MQNQGREWLLQIIIDFLDIGLKLSRKKFVIVQRTIVLLKRVNASGFLTTKVEVIENGMEIMNIFLIGNIMDLK